MLFRSRPHPNDLLFLLNPVFGCCCGCTGFLYRPTKLPSSSARHYYHVSCVPRTEDADTLTSTRNGTGRDFPVTCTQLDIWRGGEPRRRLCEFKSASHDGKGAPDKSAEMFSCANVTCCNSLDGARDNGSKVFVARRSEGLRILGFLGISRWSLYRYPYSRFRKLDCGEGNRHNSPYRTRGTHGRSSLWGGQLSFRSAFLVHFARVAHGGR